jgi:hypothetical protein
MKERFMKTRVRSFWIPALASFGLVSVLLFTFTTIGAQSHYLVMVRAGLGLWFLYAGWLVAHVVSGAFAAFLSRRARGSRSDRILSSLFPAIVMLGIWGGVIPISAMIQHTAYVLKHPLYYAFGVFPWVVVPGIALLTGALPFLRTVETIEPRRA